MGNLRLLRLLHWQQILYHSCFPDNSAGKESACQRTRPRFDFWVGKFPWRRDRLPIPVFLGFPHGSDGKESACNAGDLGLIPGLGKIPWRRAWQPTPVFLPGEFHGQRSQVGYSPRGRKESDTTEQLSLSNLNTFVYWASLVA